METKSYAEKLKDPRWQRKRLEIMDRDGWKCTLCNSTDTTLAVHHLNYQKGFMPWEYDNSSLVTLCENCHKEKHRVINIIENEGIMNVKDFIKENTDVIEFIKSIGNDRGCWTVELTEGNVHINYAFLVAATIFKWDVCYPAQIKVLGFGDLRDPVEITLMVLKEKDVLDSEECVSINGMQGNWVKICYQ